ncbi:MAG: DUF389 domain-containing protein [Rivularia sp. (in: cyanobacteria)]
MLLLLKRFGSWSKLKLTELWYSNSGDWHWLSEKPMPIAGINRKLWRGAVPSLSFYTLLSLSAVISTLGLLASSAATIIGAMIIAPLMGPIIAIAYSIASGNQRLLKRSSFTSSIVFLAHDYGYFQKARHGLVISVPSLIILGLPLGLSLETFLVKEHTRRHIEYLLYRRTITFSNSDIKRIDVRRDGERFLVDMEVAVPFESLSANQVQLVQEFLQDNLNKRLTLKVKVIPIQEYTAS